MKTKVVLEAKERIKIRKKRLDTPAPKVIKPKTAYDKKDKSWQKEVED